MFKNVLISLRPHFWVLSIIPALVGAYIANGNLIDWQKFLLIAFMIGPCLSGIGELVNDYADRKTDVLQHVKRIWKFPFSGGSGVVVVGGINKQETITVTLLLASAAFLTAFYLNFREIAVVIGGLFVALEYSLEPLHAKSRGIAGPLLFASGFRGLLSFHAGWLAFAPVSSLSLSISIFLALLYFATFELSHLADYNEDKLLKINTFPVQAGFDLAKNISGGFVGGSLVWLIIAYLENWLTLNILALPWLILNQVFLAKYIALNNNRDAIMRLVPLALAVICTAPLIFI